MERMLNNEQYYDDLRRKETNIQQNISHLNEELAKTDEALRSIARVSIENGSESVQKVLNTFRKRGGPGAQIAEAYYGHVIENFDCSEDIYKAVEVTAGNSLFHHIVKSDKVGTQIWKEMKRQKLPGEFTLMPLNRLCSKPQNYSVNNDAIPLITKLRYDGKYDKAMKYIFGKTFLCRNLDVARRYARAKDLDYVTFEGDHISSEGVLTGGCSSLSRLDLLKTRSELREQIQKCELELRTLREKINK